MELTDWLSVLLFLVERAQSVDTHCTAQLQSENLSIPNMLLLGVQLFDGYSRSERKFSLKDKAMQMAN